VNGKIIVDSELFQRMNPNYTRPNINLPHKRSDGSGLSFWECIESDSNSVAQTNKVDPEEANDTDLLVCSPTVLGFSLNDKLWCKYLLSLFLLR